MKKRKREAAQIAAGPVPPGAEEVVQESDSKQAKTSSSAPTIPDIHTKPTVAPPTHNYSLPEDDSTPIVPPAAAKAAAQAQNPNKQKVFLRKAAGKIWADNTLAEWPENDHRLFCGDLGNEVNDNTLAKVFVKYASFAKAKVVRDNRTQKTKGYGFVSFLDPFDAAQALKEMQGAYVGNRPIKLSKSKWGKRAYQAKGKKKNHLF